VSFEPEVINQSSPQTVINDGIGNQANYYDSADAEGAGGPLGSLRRSQAPNPIGHNVQSRITQHQNLHREPVLPVPSAPTRLMTNTRRELFHSPQHHSSSVTAQPMHNSPDYTTYGYSQPSFTATGNPLGMTTSPEFPYVPPARADGFAAEHADDEQYWSDVKKSLIANDGVDHKEQCIKSLRTIERFPRCSKAPELREWLLDVVTKVRNSCNDPIAAAKWIREATSGTDLKKQHHFQR
jgi:hypothetical protein